MPFLRMYGPAYRQAKFHPPRTDLCVAALAFSHFLVSRLLTRPAPLCLVDFSLKDLGPRLDFAVFDKRVLTENLAPIFSHETQLLGITLVF